MDRFSKARLIAFGVPLALMAGALGSQYIGKLVPCEMCHWQRWPHYAAIAMAGVSFFAGKELVARLLVVVAALAVLISGLIGVFHAGVEYGWWRGITDCANMAGSGSFIDVMKTPTVSCDQPQWTLGPISLAGFNALISITAALFVIGLISKRKPSL